MLKSIYPQQFFLRIKKTYYFYFMFRNLICNYEETIVFFSHRLSLHVVKATWNAVIMNNETKYIA